MGFLRRRPRILHLVEPTQAVFCLKRQLVFGIMHWGENRSKVILKHHPKDIQRVEKGTYGLKSTPRTFALGY
jgi:hypothetical protein